MSHSSHLGTFVLQKQPQSKAIHYQGPGHLKEIADDVEFKYEEDGETPVIYDDGSIEIANGGYYFPQFSGDTRCEPKYIKVNPGQVIVFPLYSSKNAFTISKEEFDKIYKRVE